MESTRLLGEIFGKSSPVREAPGAAVIRSLALRQGQGDRCSRTSIRCLEASAAVYCHIVQDFRLEKALVVVASWRATSFLTKQSFPSLSL